MVGGKRRRYPQYKGLPVAWLPTLPSGWEARRLKFCAQLVNAKVADAEQDFYVALENVESLTGRYLPSEVVGEPESVVSRFAVDDVLFGKLLPYLAKAWKAERAGVCSTEFFVLRGRKYAPEFLRWLCLSPGFVGQVDGSTFGSKMPRASWDDVGELPTPLPPQHEQRAIAAFLDRETARIDALIEKKRRLIELLQEKRAAVISVAVTKGLDPLASMKDSGEKWMGRVPTHWNVAALGYLATVETGATPDRDNAAFWDGDIPWIKTGEIDYRPIRGAEECITQAGLLNSSTRISPPGTLLMAMYGQGTTRGRVALLEVHAAYNQACAAIRFGPRVIGQFGRYFFIAAYDFIRDFGNETSQMNLSASIIRKFRLPVPPLDEQAAIVSKLDSETSTIEALAGRVQSAIDLLQEQRSAIISAAVTGQIDVREAA